MNTIRKISLKAAAWTNIVTIIIVAAVHLLVVLQVIPYDWINGGRSSSLQAQQQISIISILVLAIMALINFCAYKLSTRSKVLYVARTIILWVLFAYSIVGATMQLFGTVFEKLCMSVLCIINIVMYFRMAIENNQTSH